MGVANFFDKTALGAAQILKDFNREAFENILEQQCIRIVFDDDAAAKSEAKASLDLLVRLIARLYPNVQIVNRSAKNSPYAITLEALAKNINPRINLSKRSKSTIDIVVGNEMYESTSQRKFYIGSDGWISKFSSNKPMGSGSSNNPFGAGAAACFAAANVFRSVFKDQLKKGDLDTEFAVCTYRYSRFDRVETPDTGPQLLDIDLGETQLVGVGAIGNSVVWALSNLSHLRGNLEIIDHQKIDLSNLQRYILTTQDDVGKDKVSFAKEFLNSTELNIIDVPYKWGEYLSQRKDFMLERVAVCVDSAADRVAVQGSLPKKIFNAWTQPASLGVSRHINFLESACLACLYMPDEKKKSRSVVISESLGLLAHELIIRKYLATKTPVDNAIISLVSAAKGIPEDQLIQFLGKDIEVFYSEFVCGGVLMRLEGTPNQGAEVEVPSAFESALAGILLAAEIVIDAGNLRDTQIHSISKFNLLRPVTNYLLEEQHKHHSNRCICQDRIFRDVYSVKWNNP
ncbi:MAG: E2 ligase fold family C protein [Bacteroidia bacterium]|jgi:molybdopterin/thiamine biosynthesis adenylyltransferase|nr:E2 ligase fold family C protein [Bacteroidia bacterium]